MLLTGTFLSEKCAMPANAAPRLRQCTVVKAQLMRLDRTRCHFVGLDRVVANPDHALLPDRLLQGCQARIVQVEVKTRRHEADDFAEPLHLSAQRLGQGDGQLVQALLGSRLMWSEVQRWEI